MQNLRKDLLQALLSKWGCNFTCSKLVLPSRGIPIQNPGIRDMIFNLEYLDWDWPNPGIQEVFFWLFLTLLWSVLNKSCMIFFTKVSLEPNVNRYLFAIWFNEFGNHNSKEKICKFCVNTLVCLISVPGRLFILRKFSTLEVYIWHLKRVILVIFDNTKDFLCFLNHKRPLYCAFR